MYIYFILQSTLERLYYRHLVKSLTAHHCCFLGFQILINVTIICAGH